jgi:hypothetical protein
VSAKNLELLAFLRLLSSLLLIASLLLQASCSCHSALDIAVDPAVPAPIGVIAVAVFFFNSTSRDLNFCE